MAIADTIRRAAECVEDFRGDCEQLAAMMRASWARSTETPYLYTAEFLAGCLRYPGSDVALAPAIYHGPELVAFLAGCPRGVTVGGVPRRVLVATFLTVAPAQQSSGYGILVWGELMRRAARMGFDGVINYCGHDGPMIAMIARTCSLLELPLRRVATFSYLARLIAEPADARRDHRRDATVAELLVAASAATSVAGLSRRWTEPEAEWQLSRLDAVSVSGTTGGDPAVITAYVAAIADAAETKCLVIDDVLWGDAVAHQREALVRDLVLKGASAGARAAIVPMLGYADLGPFITSGFRPAPHTISAYLTLWADSQADPWPERYYLDVI
ncbi:MAG: hypothetical protein ABSH51_02220 [Solirubrobacteraceae bacterium]